MTRIRTAFAGARGRMGLALLPGLERADDVEVVARVDEGDDLVSACRAARCEVVIDFTTPAAAVSNARRILEAGCHGVIGTTGFTEGDLVDLDARARAASRALLVAPNFALGSILLQRLAAEASRWFPCAEIVEVHHDGKRDAPSGTALRTAAAIAEARARGGAPGAESSRTVGRAVGGDARAGETGAVGASPDGDAARGLEAHGVRIHAVRLPGFVAHQEVLFGGQGEALTLRHDAFSRECYLPGVLLGVRAVRGRVGLLRGLEAVLPPPS